MTRRSEFAYCPCCMEGWQYKAAFVVQFRPETDLGRGRCEGKIEQVSTYRSIKFHSLDELLAFIAETLNELCNDEDEGER